ncbi:N-acetylmuramoyl-L-alanine amidase family protein [Clostridium weizhouense]|uniref:N-acetylmuramoyl-L-alanine amidase family protein n=1 Tax=Clostridium weizhouense TaxID=2859781 RepID=A0ABS7ANR4_9CLOT|nr:N-acetylmuramoyl-L-alanine amidase family protein [Clostridium weizhouense]MBW6410279.1 N-acetylmuramoyl-L-alanine amidase family protein [Clostridium weizhouense]
MKRNMHAKTIALVLAAITGVQATGIAQKFEGVNTKAYAEGINNNDIKETGQVTTICSKSEQYGNAGITVQTTTPGSVIITVPNNFTDDNKTALEKLKGSDQSTSNKAYIGIQFTTPQVTTSPGVSISKIKINDKIYDLSKDSKLPNNDEIINGKYIKYIEVATKDSNNKWIPSGGTLSDCKYEWLNSDGKVVLAKTSLKTEIQRNASAKVSISGTEKVGKTLEANVTAYLNGKITTPTKIEYQWYRSKKKDRDFDRISSETDREYKIASRDEDKYIKVIAKVTVNGETIEVNDRTGSIDERSSHRSHRSSGSGSGSTADSDEIKDEIKDAKDDEASYDVSDYPRVEKEVFEYLKDKDDRTLVLEGDDYTWTFKTKDIKNVSDMDGKLDTTIETTSPNESEIKKVLNGADVVNLYFKYDGKLPGKAKVKVDIGSEYNDKKMYVYYYNKNSKSLELIDSNVKVDDDDIEFSINKVGDYVLSETPLLGSVATISGNGWNMLSDGNWQYISSGNKALGWNFIDGRWYFMDALGTMQRGWVTSNGSWYYLNYSGDMATGWKLLGDKWYYLRDDGKMLTGWVDDMGTWYYMYSDGSMARNTTVDGYKLGSNGAWIR